MITKLNLETVDKSGMYKIYDRWPEIAKNAYEFNWEPLTYQNIDHVIFAGMGGSGSIGDIFSSILSKTKLHISVIKGYNLPKTINENSLVVVTSVSGNTVEALSILNQAKNLNCKLIAVSSGGKMEEICKANKIDYRKIIQFHSPRASLVNFLYAMLKILKIILPINEKEIMESIKNIQKLGTQISSNNLTHSNQALNLAQKISGIPVIYFPWGLQSVGIRFKNSLQENAKMHAIAEDVVETSHNGIVAWEKESQVFPILIQGLDDNEKTKDRWKIFKTYFNNNKIDFEEVLSIEGNIISKIIHLMYLLDYTSIYISILSNMDPTPIKSIDFIKSKL